MALQILKIGKYVGMALLHRNGSNTNMTIKEQKESFDRLVEVSKKEAEVSKETYERTNLENKNEIDRLKKELEKKEIEVKQGLRDNNNERKLKATITLEAKEAQVEHNKLKIKYKELKDELEAKKRALQDAQDHYQTITIDEPNTNEMLSKQVKNKDIKIEDLEKEINKMKKIDSLFNKDVQGEPCKVVPGHLTTSQQEKLPAVEGQVDLTLDSTYHRSSECNTSIEPAALDTTTDNFGDSYQVMSESDTNMACRPKRRRDSNKRSVKTDRDSSSYSSYKSSKSSKEVFKIPDQPLHRKSEAEKRNERKIKN